MDLLAQDIADLHSQSDPCIIIRLLYSNFLIRIAKLLTPHFSEVKIAADNHCQLGLHPKAVAEGAIGSAESVDSLFNLMSIKKMWDNTCFFRKVVAAIPANAPERQAAQGILLHYNTHLDIFKKATLLRDALAKETKIDEKKTGSNEDDKLIPLKIHLRNLSVALQVKTVTEFRHDSSAQPMASRKRRSSARTLMRATAQLSPLWSQASTCTTLSSGARNCPLCGYCWSWTSSKWPSLESSPSFPLLAASCHC